ncbi:hypothetical protein [Roseovarius indicus]|uniref:Uncharacterized protein n=1 Tax=Roseovarius indicus TaxID=540747 RepID=A0A5P3ADR6_9RHOB|nr:hypothetical protein [Roseovarius indicus]QEW26468.1 hypothetical protein RIdsm_02268 [Roseovarius indicus]SFE62471.1 hypothetical protein SAMN04488031_11415 [Roseovarius indicus]
MTALPDFADQFQAHDRRSALREPVDAVDGPGGMAGRFAMFCAATALMMAAAGIWMFPAPDHAVMLVKLGASLGMFGAGAVLLSGLNATQEMARVEIDAGRDEIRTYDRELRGRVFLTGRYRMSEFAEIRLCNRTFFARDTAGQLVVSVPVRSRSQERAIRSALSLA